MEGSFTQGCDPEFFLYNAEHERYISAIPFVEGTKQQPQPLANGGFVMRDNVAIEFGMPPAKTVEEWIHSLNTTIADLKAYIPAHLELRIVPSADFHKQQLGHPEAQEIGCEPDFNAWTGKRNIPPLGFAESTFRSCGGHIHVGYVEGSGNDFLLDTDGKRLTIQIMDCYHGIISTILDSSEAAVARRDIYGKAGCYRSTDYGVEYRTLSNYWCGTDTLKKLMYFLTDEVLTCIRNGKADQLIETMGGPKVIQSIINTGDITRADACVSILSDYISDDTKLITQEAFNA